MTCRKTVLLTASIGAIVKNGRPSALAWAAICDQNGVAVTFSYSLITSLTFGLNAFNFSIDMPALQE